MLTEDLIYAILSLVPRYPDFTKGYKIRAKLLRMGYGPYHEDAWGRWIKKLTEGQAPFERHRLIKTGRIVHSYHPGMAPMLIRLPGNGLARPSTAADWQHHVKPFTKPPKKQKPTLAEELKQALEATNPKKVKNN